MIAGTLAEIAAQMPTGFHDTELLSLTVDWPKKTLRMTGVAWVAEEGPPEIYRSFSLAVENLHAVILPESVVPDAGAETWHVKQLPARIDGIEGWPPGKDPVANAPGAFTYSFFVTQWNDFVVVHAMSASLEWLGPPERGRGRRTSG